MPLSKLSLREMREIYKKLMLLKAEIHGINVTDADIRYFAGTVPKDQTRIKALYGSLFRGENTLYRSSPFPKTKFSRKEQLTDLGETMELSGEPGGIYWAKEERDLDPLIVGYRRSVNTPDVVGVRADQTAAALPTARQKRFTEKEWRSQKRVPWRKLTNQLRKDYDIIDVPDLAVESSPLYQSGSLPPIRQKIQLNPRSVVTKIGDKYKILGTVPIGSTAAGDMSLNEWHEYQKKRGRLK